jgi:hypothetical protein
VGGIARRIDERRFRIVELAGDREEVLLGDRASIGKDGELVAAEDRVGEDVGGQVAV